MAWTYSDYVTYADTSVDRLDRLRLHIAEVSQEISNPQSSTGPDGLGAEASHNLVEYLKTLQNEERRLVNRGNSATSAGLVMTRAVLKGDS